jgi:hypothetical protein
MTVLGAPNGVCEANQKSASFSNEFNEERLFLSQTIKNLQQLGTLVDFFSIKGISFILSIEKSQLHGAALLKDVLILSCVTMLSRYDGTARASISLDLTQAFQERAERLGQR